MGQSGRGKVSDQLLLGATKASSKAGCHEWSKGNESSRRSGGAAFSVDPSIAAGDESSLEKVSSGETTTAGSFAVIVEGIGMLVTAAVTLFVALFVGPFDKSSVDTAVAAIVVGESCIVVVDTVDPLPGLPIFLWEPASQTKPSRLHRAQGSELVTPCCRLHLSFCLRQRSHAERTCVGCGGVVMIGDCRTCAPRSMSQYDRTLRWKESNVRLSTSEQHGGPGLCQ